MAAGGDCGKAACRRVEPPQVVVLAPALDRAAPCADCAGVGTSDAHGAKAACRRVGHAFDDLFPLLRFFVPFAPGVPAPTLDRAALAQSARVNVPGAHCGKAACWGIGLPIIYALSVVVRAESPALDLSRFAGARCAGFECRGDRAGVVRAGAHGGKASCRRVGLSTLGQEFESPALDLSRFADRAGLPSAPQSGLIDGCWAPAHGDKRIIKLRRADRDLRAAQPAVGARLGGEVASVGQDALSAGRRECEFDPAVVVQPRIDPADRFSLYLYWAAVQPAAYLCVGREVALGRQDSLTAGGLPAELGSAIGESLRDDAAGLLLVALRVRDLYRPGRRQRQQRRQTQQQRSTEGFTPPPPEIRANVQTHEQFLLLPATRPGACATG